MVSEIIKKAREISETPLVFARYFERPKCKPWDIIKGRRFACCHGKGEHTRLCFKGITSIAIPRIGKISVSDLVQ